MKIAAAVAGALAIAGLAVLISVVKDMAQVEARTRIERLPFAMLWLARRRVPRPLRDVLHEEWSAELAEILDEREEMPLTRVWVGVRYAFGLLRSARAVAQRLGRVRADRDPDQHGEAPEAGVIMLARRGVILRLEAHTGATRADVEPFIPTILSIIDRRLQEVEGDERALAARMVTQVGPITITKLPRHPDVAAGAEWGPREWTEMTRHRRK